MSGGWDFTSLAKTALSTAQKRIDKVLDIKEEDGAAPGSSDDHSFGASPYFSASSGTGDEAAVSSTAKQLQDDFFAAFGLGGGSRKHNTEGDSASLGNPKEMDKDDQEEEDPVSTEGSSTTPSFLAPFAATSTKLGSLFAPTEKLESPERGWSTWLGAGPPEESTESHGLDSSGRVREETSEGLPKASETEEGVDGGEVRETRQSYEEVDLVTAPSLADESSSQEIDPSCILTFVDESKSEESSHLIAQTASQSASSLEMVNDWVQSGWNMEEVPDVLQEKAQRQEGEEEESLPSRGPVDSASQSVSLTASSSATLGRPESSGGMSLDTEEDSSGHSQSTMVDTNNKKENEEEGLNGERRESLAEELAAVEKKESQSEDAIVAGCVESVLRNVTDNLSPRDPITVEVSEEAHGCEGTGSVTPEGERGSEESSGGAGQSSIADSFVHLEASEGSPPLSLQKSETSSLVKGSGYTSPTDELETAASSDIEVISTNNGDASSERSSRSGVLSVPHGWQGPPGRMGCLKESMEEARRTHRRSGSDHGFTESFSGMPPSGFTNDKVMQLAEALEAREKKVLELSREVVQLSDENESLRRQLHQIQQDKVGTEKALSNLQEKFTAASEDRDKMRKKCERLEREHQNTGIGIPQLQRLLREKEEQIDELANEGDKLSKRELKHTGIIKKLREKEKETEKLMESHKQKLAEMESLKQKLRDKGTQEIKYDEVMHQMKSTIEKQEKRIHRQQTELDEANEKSRSLKVTLDNVYRQVSELTREKVAKEAEVHQLQSEAVASQEQKLQERLQMLEKEKTTERLDLSRQIEELQLNLVQSSAESDRRELSLKWEMTQLQRKLQEAENRNHELSDSITSATKPLLRQIESLQSSFTTQQTNWERVEKALYDRITDSEQKALIASDKERSASAAALEIRAQQGQMEAQLNSLSREKTKLEHQLALAKRDSDKVDEMRKKFQVDLEFERNMNKRAIEELEKEKEMLSTQFQQEKTQTKVELEERIKDLMRQVDEREQMLTVMRSQLIDLQMNEQSGARHSPLGVRTVPELRRSLSPTSTIASFLEESGDDLWTLPQDGTGFSSLLEKMRTKLQQRDGELAVLRDEVRHLQQSRDSVTHELVNIGNSQQAMEQRVSQFDSLQEKYRELDQRYQALLQMYGEKVEQNEELKLDLQDVKSMYKQQIEDLLIGDASS